MRITARGCDAGSAAAPIEVLFTRLSKILSDSRVVLNETSDDPLPLFGPPTVSRNSLDFNPLAFTAFSDGGGNDVTSADLAFRVAAKSSSVIEGITLSEIGNATLAGNVAPGSMGTSAAVVASGVLHIHEVDFVGINDIAVPFALTFSPSGGNYFLGTDGGGGRSFPRTGRAPPR